MLEGTELLVAVGEHFHLAGPLLAQGRTYDELVTLAAQNVEESQRGQFAGLEEVGQFQPAKGRMGAGDGNSSAGAGRTEPTGLNVLGVA